MRAASALWAVAAMLALPGAGQDYPEYRAAQEAAKAGDCRGVVEHLNAFLDAYPYVREPQHRAFYLRVRRVIDECTGRVVIRGVGEEGGGMSPLPDDPPAR